MLPNTFSPFQVASLAGLGAIYWAIAACKIRYLGPIVYANDLRRLSMFVLLPPVGYVLMRVSEAIVGIDSKERLASTAIMCASALLLDGAAFMWLPTIYENPGLKEKDPPAAVTISRMGAAWILGGVGIIFVMALLT